MIISLKNKDTLNFDEFKFKCCIGKNKLNKKKIEGDNITPTGTFKLGPLYYRPDRIKKPLTNINCFKITKNAGWCNEPLSKFYNKKISLNNKIGHEKLWRKDNKYDLILLIHYNVKNTVPGKGSAIFLHLTKNFKPTAGCIAILKKDFLILIKLIDKKTKIKIS